MIGKLSEQQMHTILERNKVGRIGCSNNSRTLVVPVCYVFNGKDIIAHSAEGMKISIMRNNPGVCFEVDEVNSITDWRSVIIWGQYHEIMNEKERYYAMKYLMSRLMQFANVEKLHQKTMANDEGEFHANIRPVVYRIVIEEMTGRFEKEDINI